MSDGQDIEEYGEQHYSFEEDNSAVGDNDEDEDTAEFVFPSDIYSELLISWMHREEEQGHERCLVIFTPWVLGILCALCQFYGTWSVLGHVSNNMMRGVWGPIIEKLWLLAAKEQTMPKNIYEPICGTFEEYGYDVPDVSATIPFPVPSTEKILNMYFYAKMPEWSWNTNDLSPPDSRSTIDSARFVVDEGILSLPHHGYGMLFLLVMFIWTCGVLIEYRQIARLGLFLWASPSASESEKMLSMKDGKWHLKGMSCSAKCLGFGICLLQFCICTYLYFIGSIFLVWTEEKVDLVLNSLALGFILELDAIVFVGLVSKKHQTFVDDLDALKYDSKLPGKYREHHRFFFPYAMLVVGLGSAVLIRWWQIQEYSTVYDSAALLCLFGGTSVKEDSYVPVAGFCESALALTCQSLSCPGGTGEACPFVDGFGSCVITDVWTEKTNDIMKPSVVSKWPQDTIVNTPGANLFDMPFNTDPSIQAKFFGNHKNYAFPTLSVVTQACWAMYKPERSQEVETDDDTGEQNSVAPFSCKKAGGAQKLLSPLGYQKGCSGYFFWDYMFCNEPHGYNENGVSILNKAVPLSTALLNC